MSDRDIARDFERTVSILPSATKTVTTTGEEVDCSGGLGLVYIDIAIGAVATADATNLFTFTVTQCATTGGTFTAAASGQYDWVDGDGIINATTEANSVMALNFRLNGSYPFIKVVATETGTASAFFNAIVHVPKRSMPAST